jgi:hypothetical protein
MPQEAIFFLSEFEEAEAQLLQLTPQALEVGRTRDRDRFGKAALAELGDGAIDLPDRARHEQGKEQDQDHGTGHQRPMTLVRRTKRS